MSPDGTRLFVTGIGNNGSFVTIAYDFATGAKLWTSVYPGLASLVDVSPDGHLVYASAGSCSDSKCDLATVAYDAGTGAEVWTSRHPSQDYSRATSMAVSPDGSRIFVAGAKWDSTQDVVALDAHTGVKLWEMNQGEWFEDGSLAVSPDGSRVVLAGSTLEAGATGIMVHYDYRTVLLNAATGGTVWVRDYAGSPGYGDDRPSSVAISPDGSRIFVTGISCAIEVCDKLDYINGGQDVHPYVYDYATVAYEKATGTRLWVHRQAGPTPGEERYRPSLAVSPDGSRVFITGGHLLRYRYSSALVQVLSEYLTASYDAASGQEQWVSVYKTPEDPFHAATSVAVSPDGTKVFVTGESGGGWSYAQDFGTVAYEAATGAQLWSSRYGTRSSNDLATAAGVSSDGTRLVVLGRTFQGGSNASRLTAVAYKT